MPTWDRLTDSAENDVELVSFFERFHLDVPVEGVPECILGHPPRPSRRVLETAMLEPSGGLEIFRFTRQYIRNHYRTKALGCKGCLHDADCRGLHINYVRAHGYRAMRPIGGSSPVNGGD
jgi:hypothetical protein